jgi:4-hydroxybenzoate polyprenyltransferase
MRNTPYLIFVSMRPKQWVKNSFIFPALIFSQNVFNLGLLLTSIGAFVTFCFISGGVYLLNDLLDIEMDKKHPRKSLRPLASGRLSPLVAKIVFIVFFAVSLTASFRINLSFGIIALGYFMVQIAYSVFLKNVVIMDVFSIAAGFFLRVLAGAKAIEVPISSWLLICTIFISLFLALGKRRHEILLLSEDTGNHRKVLDAYKVTLLDQLVSVATTGTVISYSLYTLSQETIKKFNTKNLWFTIPIVLYGIFRYLYLLYWKEEGGDPELLLFEDKPLLASVVLYVIVIGIILYLNPAIRVQKEKLLA